MAMPPTPSARPRRRVESADGPSLSTSRMAASTICSRVSEPRGGRPFCTARGTPSVRRGVRLLVLGAHLVSAPGAPVFNQTVVVGRRATARDDLLDRVEERLVQHPGLVRAGG